MVTIGGINFGGDFNLIYVTVRLDGAFRTPVRRLSWYTFSTRDVYLLQVDGELQGVPTNPKMISPARLAIVVIPNP